MEIQQINGRIELNNTRYSRNFGLRTIWDQRFLCDLMKLSKELLAWCESVDINRICIE